MHHAIAVPSQRVGTAQHLEVIENNFGNYDGLLLPLEQLQSLMSVSLQFSLQ